MVEVQSHSFFKGRGIMVPGSRLEWLDRNLQHVIIVEIIEVTFIELNYSLIYSL